MPGIGTQDPEQWTDSNGRLWLEKITDNASPDLVVFAYGHRQISSIDFSWQSLIDKGNTFLIDLLELLKSEKVIEDSFTRIRYLLIQCIAFNMSSYHHIS